MRIRLFMLLSIVWSISCTGATDDDKKAVLKKAHLSVNQVIGLTKDFEGYELMVIGFLSNNCGGLCLYAYEDDAKLLNTPNSVQVMINAKSIHEIVEACGIGYVTLFGVYGFIEGFGRPGFVDVNEIYSNPMSKEEGSSTCWEKNELVKDLDSRKLE